MFIRILVLQFLFILLLYIHQSSSATRQPSFFKTLGRIKESKKSSAYCTSNDIKLTNKWKKKFQVLDLQSCDNSLDVITLELPKILNDSTTCLVVLIRTNITDKNFEAKLRDVLNEAAVRPLIIVFYNKYEKTESIAIIDRSSRTRNQTAKALEYASDFIDRVTNFDYDVRSDAFSEARSNMLKEAMTNGCVVCIQFAQLVDYRFAWYLRIREGQIDGLTCDADCYRALLNLPYDFDFSHSYDEVYELLHSYYVEMLRDSNSAASKINGVTYTLKEFFEMYDLPMDLEGLVEMAWRDENYKIFEFLVRADLPFPQNFLYDRENELSYGAHDKKEIKSIENFILELDSFHRNIRKGNFQRVKNFLDQNEYLVYARNVHNESALKTAFDYNQPEIFSYLKSRGMSFGSFREVGEYYKVANKYKENKKKQLRQFNRKFLRPAIETDLITKLMQKSSFAYDHHVHDESQIRYAIQRSYEKIKTTAQEILEIAAASNELQIIFDFTNSDLMEFDPVTSDAYGVAYYYYDFLIIGAKDLLNDDTDKKNYALGTVSHELMHYTMHQMYHNGISPYDEHDYERRGIIKKIYRKYEDIKDGEHLIATSYKNDEDDAAYGEFIARVPDMLFTYKDNQTYLDELKDTYKELFKFYDQYVMADMREFIPTIHMREKVRELNDWLDLAAEIQIYDFENTEEDETEADDDGDDDDENDEIVNKNKSEDLNAKKNNDNETNEEELPEVVEIQDFLNDDTKQRLKVFTSTNPKLLLQKLFYKLRMKKTLAIYVSSSFSYYGNFEQVLYKIDTIHPSVPLIINCDRIKRLNKFVQIMHKSTFRKVVAIADKEEFEKKIKPKVLERWIEITQF